MYYIISYIGKRQCPYLYHDNDFNHVIQPYCVVKASAHIHCLWECLSNATEDVLYLMFVLLLMFSSYFTIILPSPVNF